MDSSLISSRQLVSKIPQGTSLDKQIWAVYNDLQNTVDSMDRRVQLVMQKHQSQFLVAYRSHVHKIKKQLDDIKRKSQQQQKLFSSNDRIRYLQKEVAIFREQALKLYNTIDRKALELEIAKQKINEAESLSKKLEAENKQLSIQMKKMTVTQNNMARTIEELEIKLQAQNKNVQKLQMKLFTQRSRRDYMQSVRENASSLAKSRDKSPKEIKTYRNQLQDWFLECVKTVKKQIYQRKNNFTTLDLNQVNNINDFRLVDKLRLFELVLENQKLLNWLYHKIFPDKFNEIAQSLSQTKHRYFSSQGKKSQATPSQRSIDGNSESLLPKINKKSPRLSLRNQISMKNGKINISFA